ncbi:MAG: carbohydrate ABC transporter permease [Halanaerobiales bacterium]|nr:carbohydrate ABC transporter permease [Halanaerobiales bacterium]
MKMLIKKFSMVLILCIMIVLAVMILSPILLAILNSFKSNGEIYTNILSWPDKWLIENYIQVFKRTNYLRSLLNTFFLVILSVSGIIFAASMAGYKLARTKTKLSKLLFTIFILSMLIPFHSIMIGLVKVARDLSVQGSLIGLSVIYVGIGSPMAIFLYHGFTKNIPTEIEDAAMIDGCTQFQLYIKIIFPMLKPITATVAILNSLWIWNDFLLPLLMLTNKNRYTLILSTKMLFGQYNSDWSKILAILILALLPVILIYIIMQKYIVKGVSEGAIK